MHHQVSSFSHRSVHQPFSAPHGVKEELSRGQAAVKGVRHKALGLHLLKNRSQAIQAFGVIKVLIYAKQELKMMSRMCSFL